MARDALPEHDEESFKACAFWKEQLTAYDEVYADWEGQGRTIVTRYRDVRNKVNEQGQRRLNTLWANTEILTPAVYSQCPLPIVERRFLDHDPVGRVSAQVLERATRFQLESNGFHRSITRAVKDFFLPGRGQVWVRYEPELEEGVSLVSGSQFNIDDDNEKEIMEDDDSPEEEKLESTGSQLLTESVPVDYVHWEDFFVFPAHARTWEEVTAVGKRVYMSRREVEEKWGEEIASKIKADTVLDQQARKPTMITAGISEFTDRKRVIFEIWNKATRKAFWISTGYDYVIDEVDDPLQLAGFFPCPEPLFSVTTNDTCVPVPFYIEYQDQALQIDELSHRINMLGKCIKAVGTYDGSNRALKRLLDESTENELIPVNDWQRHREKGGIEGSISFLPIRDMVEALQVLVELRAKIMEDLDRVTGIADVLRGTSDARETMGGQRLKQNAANTRLDKLRDDVAVFARDVVRLVAEVIAKHFSDQSLIRSSGILYEEGLSFDDFEAMQEQFDAPASPQPVSQPQQPASGGRPPVPGNQPPVPPAGPAAAPGAPLGPSGAPGQPAQPGMPAAPAPGAPGAPPGLPAPMGAPVAPVGVPPMGMPPIFEKLQRIQKALKLLRDDVPRGYRIIIETDSTIAGEVALERDAVIQFLTAVTKFLEQAQIIGSQNPQIVPVLGKLLQFGVRKFRTGRDVESAIDDFIDGAMKSAKQLQENPGLKPPSPEQLKVQADMRKAEAEIQKINLTGQIQAQNDQRHAQLQELQAQRDVVAQQAEEQRQTRLAEMKFQYEMRTLEMRMQMEQKKLGMQMEFEAAKQQREAQHEQHRMMLEHHRRQAEHEFGMREMAAQSQENEANRVHQAKLREQQVNRPEKAAA